MKPDSRIAMRAPKREIRLKGNGLGEESGEKERPSPSESFPKFSTAFGRGGSPKKTNFYDLRGRRTLILQPAWLTDGKIHSANTETALYPFFAITTLLGLFAVGRATRQ